MSMSLDAARTALRDNPVWYHTIELAPGVVTPGQVDLRAAAERLLPDDLRGKRALDVGTFDGFWAFEMERRGADVIAIDTERIDENEWPPLRRPALEAEAQRRGVELGRGFRLAAGALGSCVQRQVCNVYELTPEAIDGQVDLVFSGAILLHLRDPVRALERIASVLRPGGELRLMEPLEVGLTLLAPRRPLARFGAAESEFNWWQANLAGLRGFCIAAGFQRVKRLALLRPPSSSHMRQVYAGLAAELGATT
jgi:SAM-dependent methyltransferase